MVHRQAMTVLVAIGGERANHPGQFLVSGMFTGIGAGIAGSGGNSLLKR
jgi:hypothetical protein